MKIKKGNKFRNTILLIVLLLAGIGLYKAGEYIKHLGDGITAEDRLLQEKLDNLPVLKTDGEIKGLREQSIWKGMGKGKYGFKKRALLKRVGGRLKSLIVCPAFGSARCRSGA